MFRNYFVAAIRNLFRDRAYAGINICGLALGFAAAILIGLYVRDELTYDRMYPDAGRIFRVSQTIKAATRTALAVADGRIAPALDLDFPEVESSTRLLRLEGSLRAGNVEVAPSVMRWGDANFFRMFPMKVVAGDPAGAMARPGTIVLSRNLARQLFGREDVVGQTVELNRQQTLHIGAVIENLPSNTHFNFEAIASASGDQLSRPSNTHTYLRLRPGADVAKLSAALPAFTRRHFTETMGDQPAWGATELTLVALPDIHFLPPNIGEMKAPADRRTVHAFIVVGLLILFVASSNFVGMMTARSARRAVEVGVRKAVGATRRQIIVQFQGECLFYAGLALGMALLAVELILPAFNGFLQRDMTFDYVRQPALGAAIVAAWLGVSLAAGAYAAFVLSMFRPVAVLKGVFSLPGGPGRLRQLLVVLQFGTLVALIVSSLTIYRQTRFALEDQLRVPGEQLYLVEGVPCFYNFAKIALAVPGIRDASCVSAPAMGMDRGSARFPLQSGESLNLNAALVGTRYFGIVGITPVAGRVFDEQHGEDNLLADPKVTANPSMVLNESAARVLGYAKTVDAVGATRHWARLVRRDGQYQMLDAQPSRVIGVVPDFTVGSIRSAIEPTVYYIDPRISFGLVLKLDGQTIPEAMRGLEAAWKKASDGRPFGGKFLNQILNAVYADILRQRTLFAAFSAVAIVVAALGLLGLAVFTAQRRTREIGLRKVMGASRLDILRFISWQFARPVLIANLIAWPCAWFFMRRWLEGFAYHVELGVLTFLAASGLALLIALITVAGHALVVARSKPVEALRYE
jgi:putative ABC transport system permease protein